MELKELLRNSGILCILCLFIDMALEKGTTGLGVFGLVCCGIVLVTNIDIKDE